MNAMSVHLLTFAYMYLYIAASLQNGMNRMLSEKN